MKKIMIIILIIVCAAAVLLAFGDKVPVLYDPLNPSNPRQNTFADLWFDAYMSLEFGIAAFILGMAVLDVVFFTNLVS